MVLLDFTVLRRSQLTVEMKKTVLIFFISAQINDFPCLISLLRTAHLKIIFPLFSCLIGKKISFPRIHMKNISLAVQDLFGRVVRWENFTRNQHLKWVTQSRRKTDQFCCVCIRTCIVVFGTIFLCLVGDICLRFKDKSICGKNNSYRIIIIVFLIFIMIFLDLFQWKKHLTPLA